MKASTQRIHSQGSTGEFFFSWITLQDPPEQPLPPIPPEQPGRPEPPERPVPPNPPEQPDPSRHPEEPTPPIPPEQPDAPERSTHRHLCRNDHSFRTLMIMKASTHIIRPFYS